MGLPCTFTRPSLSFPILHEGLINEFPSLSHQCLGGMPHGPCGEQFRAAFSCFVYSEQEPKGIECVEKFKDMQECFRAHPDVYGECASLFPCLRSDDSGNLLTTLLRL